VPNLQPEIFQPGTHSFTVPFDGTKMRWILTSYNGTQKTAAATEASAGSMRCKKPGRRIAEPANPSVAPVVVLYPNPAKDIVTITTDKGVIAQNDVLITDATGKAFIPQRVTRISPQAIQVDGSRNMGKGVYFIKVKVDDTYKVLRVVKL
jgi:hypothetical protein